MIRNVRIYSQSYNTLFFDAGMCENHLELAQPLYSAKEIPFYISDKEEDTCLICVYSIAREVADSPAEPLIV